MKKLLLTIFFLTWAYPEALLYHLIAGGFLGWLGATILGTDAGAYSTGLIGAGVFLVLGALVWLTCRPKSLNVKARDEQARRVLPLLALLLLLASAASCARPASVPEQASVSTYTDGRGFEVPVQTTADSLRAPW